MKWNLLIITILLTLTAGAQQPNFNGGSNDGSTANWLERSYGYNMYNQWSYGDGATVNKLPAPTAFNMFKGGAADGSAWHNGHSPLAINMYNGGKQDGYAESALPGASFNLYKGGSSDGYANAILPVNSFNLYKGGANDGQSASALTPATAFNMYAGGNSDGFAWHNGYSPIAINLFAGGSNDGFGTGSLLPATSFNVFAGGSNDGFANSRLTPSAMAFNPYRGGTKDGFAFSTNRTPPPVASNCGNPVIIQQTTVSNLTKTSATFSWNTFNPGVGSSYNIWVRSGGVSGPVIRFYTDTCTLTSNTINITGLPSGGNYCLTLQEHCPAGLSTEVSNSACFFTYPEDCPPPTVLQHLGNTGSSISLGWTPGADNASYEIRLVKMGTSTTYNYGGPITTSPMRVTLNCLPSSSFFTYEVRESCGNNQFSEWVNGYSTYTSTGCTAPTALTGSIVNAQNATLSWESLYTNEADKPYQISYGLGITSAAQGTLTPVTTITPAQVSGSIRSHNLFVGSGVSNLTCYVREVCSMCDTTVWTGPYTLPAACTAPATGNMSVTNLTSNSATLNWVSANLNSAALVQVINYSSNTSVYYNYTASNIYTRLQALTGLLANTNYGWRVKEYCSGNDSTAFSNWQSFTTPALSGSCSAPTNQGIFVTFGSVLIAKWDCPFYPDTLRGYQVAAGMNINSPAEATIVQGSKYFRTQSPTNPTHFFSAGNTPGFTWYVRDICAPGDTSAWLGPYVMGSAKTDGSEVTSGVIDEEEEEQVMLQLFPNPNGGNQLTVKAAALGNSATLTIYNLQGDLIVHHELYPDGLTTVDISTLSNATYLCRVNSPATVQTVRLVIQR